MATLSPTKLVIETKKLDDFLTLHDLYPLNNSKIFHFQFYAIKGGPDDTKLKLMLYITGKHDKPFFNFELFEESSDKKIVELINKEKSDNNQVSKNEFGISKESLLAKFNAFKSPRIDLTDDPIVLNELQLSGHQIKGLMKWNNYLYFFPATKIYNPTYVYYEVNGISANPCPPADPPPTT